MSDTDKCLSNLTGVIGDPKEILKWKRKAAALDKLEKHYVSTWKLDVVRPDPSKPEFDYWQIGQLDYKYGGAGQWNEFARGKTLLEAIEALPCRRRSDERQVGTVERVLGNARRARHSGSGALPK